jgi:hypothetical protein
MRQRGFLRQGFIWEPKTFSLQQSVSYHRHYPIIPYNSVLEANITSELIPFSSHSGTFRLNETKVRELHTNLQTLWMNWLLCIPPQWQATCPLLQTSAPVAVTLNFGQNKPLWSPCPKELAVNRFNFLSSLEWETVRSLDFALAAVYG